MGGARVPGRGVTMEGVGTVAAVREGVSGCGVPVEGGHGGSYMSPWRVGSAPCCHPGRCARGAVPGVGGAVPGAPQAQVGMPQLQVGMPQAQVGIPQAQVGLPQVQVGIPQV